MPNPEHMIEDPFAEIDVRTPAAVENDKAPGLVPGVANNNAPTTPALVLQPAGDRSAPQLELRHVGDGRAFIRALARAIVRRELISAGLIAAPDPCPSKTRAG